MSQAAAVQKFHDSGPRPAPPPCQSRIRDICRLFDLTPRAVRLYEQRGLVTPWRDSYGRRTYDPDHHHRFALIAEARRAGLSLQQIGDLLEDRERGGDGSLLRAYCQARLEALAGERNSLDRLLALTDSPE